MMWPRIVFTLVFVFFLCFGAAGDPGYDRVLRVSDGKIIHFEQMIEEIRTSDLVFVGEVHNNLKHHRAQLRVIQSLHELKVPAAIGIEMFKAKSQRELDQWLSGKMVLKDFIDVYHENWGIPWPWYKNIFLYAKNYEIPMVGLNLPAGITEKVSQRGFASLTAEELKDLPPGITCDIDARYIDFMKKVYKSHDRDNKSFYHFCEAQMVWDKTMAWHLVAYLKKNHDKTVIVLAGTVHAWKKGVPEQVKRQSSYRFKVILPEIPDHIGKETITIDDADYLLLE